jgi:UMF1 family MFS transporter
MAPQTAPPAAATPRRTGAPPWRPFSLPVVGWVLYDLAATIFAYVVLVRYFNEWLIIEQGQPDFVTGLMLALVSIALVFALPLLGASADRIGRHKPFLVAFALSAIALVALLGFVDGVVVALIVGGLAVFAFESGEAQYHPLLASVAPPERRGLLSGVGIGLGYIGTAVAILVLGALVPEGDRQQAFLPTAGLYLLFALPCLLFVRDTRSRPPGAPASTAPGHPASMVFRQLLESIRRARTMPHGRLVAARFLYVDALATVGVYMTVYARRTGDFDSAQVDLLLAFSLPFAIVGAIVAGVLTGRIGPKPVLLGTLTGTVAVLAAVAVVGEGWVLWGAGPVVGAALGSVTATDRVFMLRLVPESRRGQDFGLYVLIGRVSSGFGPLVLWGGTIFLLTRVLELADDFEASRVAILLLGLAALGGALILRPLPNPRAGVDDEEGPPAADPVAAA